MRTALFGAIMFILCSGCRIGTYIRIVDSPHADVQMTGSHTNRQGKVVTTDAKATVMP